MPYELQNVSPRKYKVVNTDTGVIHSHSTSKKKAQSQIRLLNMLHEQHGSGFFSDMVNSVKSVGNKAIQGGKDLINKVSDLGKKVVNPGQAYPPELTQLKQDIGSENVSSIEIRRTPVPNSISTAMNIVSLNSFNKKMSRLPYDSLFHLFMVITTNKGSQALIEKNARINVERKISTLPNTTTMAVPNIPAGLTVNALIDNTQSAMGPKFLPYNPQSNNCQDFILAVLKANALATPEIENFVKQDTSSLFASDKTLARISTGLTNLGAAADILMSGGKISTPRKNKDNMDLFSPHMHIMFAHRHPQTEAQVRSALNIPVHLHMHHQMDGAGIDWGSVGRSIANTFHIPTDTSKAKQLAKTVIKYGLPALGGASGSAVGTYASGGNPIAGVLAGAAGSTAGRVASEQINRQIGNGLKRGRPRKGMSGNGWLDRSGILDKKFSTRDIIKGAKALPALAREAVADIKGGSVSDFADLAMYGVAGKRVAKKVPGITSGVEVPGLTSGVMPMPMSGKGMRPAKGSEEAREFMRKLRGMRKSKK